MVQEHRGAEGDGRMFVIMPNRAMSWRSLLLVYGVICIFTLSIGLFFTLNGMPLVLPFSGLELLALGAALYVTAWRSGIREVITIKDDAIFVESGRNAPESHHRFQRQWARIVLQRPWSVWHPSKLLIRSHGKQVEIGSFLNEEERKGLAEQLALAMHSRV